jgi:hypothetical protein
MTGSHHARTSSRYTHLRSGVGRQGYGPPLELLARAFNLELTSGRSLPSATEAEGRAAFLIGLDSVSASRWETTLRAYLAGCSARPRFGTALILGASPNCQSALHQMGVKCHPWRNAIGFRDALLWALRDRKIADPMLGRLAAETAVCLAGWELEEVTRQVQRLHSARAIFEIPASCGAQVDPSWAQGQIDEFDGVPFKRLALCDPEEVARRMWRAQVTVLFGWIETLRGEFVQHHQGWLRAARRADPTFVDTSELEWAELGRLARRSLPSADLRRRLAENTRAVRNALAHMQAVDFEMFHRLSQCIRQPRPR